jgi:CRISPR-associated protein Cas2
MVRKKFTIICYDITLNKKRNKVAALLEQYGTRRNKSVFECMVTESQLKKIRAELLRWIEPQTDTILIYRVCLNCYVQSETLGKQTPPALGSVLMV